MALPLSEPPPQVRAVAYALQMTAVVGGGRWYGRLGAGRRRTGDITVYFDRGVAFARDCDATAAVWLFLECLKYDWHADCAVPQSVVCSDRTTYAIE